MFQGLMKSLPDLSTDITDKFFSLWNQKEVPLMLINAGLMTLNPGEGSIINFKPLLERPEYFKLSADHLPYVHSSE